jgi:hypothetical protein
MHSSLDEHLYEINYILKTTEIGLKIIHQPSILHTLVNV